MKSQQLGFYKVIYLLILSSVLFLLNSFYWLGLIAVIQLLLWVNSGVKFKPLIRALFKLKWFFLIICLSYLLLPAADQAGAYPLKLYWFTLNLYPEGLITAVQMLTRICLMLMVSLWVRLSSSQADFVGALKKLKIPEIIAVVIDLSINMLTTEKIIKHQGSGSGKGSGGGKDSRKQKPKKALSYQELKSNKSGFIDRLITTNFNQSHDLISKNYPSMSVEKRTDMIIILSTVAAIMSLKMFQMLPGLPIAPGHKNLIIIPLIMLASLSTKIRYGGLAAGFATGMVSFFMGFGKFGIFEVLHFALPGLVADWLAPAVKQATGKMLALKLMLIGGLIGVTRFAANFAILILAGSPKLAWVVFIPMLTSQVIFGALSSFICMVVLSKHRKGGWFEHKPLRVENSERTVNVGKEQSK